MPNDLLAPQTLNLNSVLSPAQQQKGSGAITARVTSVDLTNEETPGLIRFESIGSTTTLTGIAKPLSLNTKIVPYVDEIVLITPGPSKDANDNQSGVDYYYQAPFSLWSTNHHNKLPSKATLAAEQKQGAVPDREVSSKIVYNLRAFPGDVIYQGRMGSSIRFGSTNEDKTLNKWSTTGDKGDPILILSNGHKGTAKKNWGSIVEDINIDQASIWMTSTQEVRIKDIIDNYKLDSFNDTTTIL